MNRILLNDYVGTLNISMDTAPQDSSILYYPNKINNDIECTSLKLETHCESCSFDP